MMDTLKDLLGPPGLMVLVLQGLMDPDPPGQLVQAVPQGLQDQLVLPSQQDPSQQPHLL